MPFCAFGIFSKVQSLPNMFELVQLHSISSMWKYVEIYCGKMWKVHIFFSSRILVTVTSKLMSSQRRDGPNMLHPILAMLPK